MVLATSSSDWSGLGTGRFYGAGRSENGTLSFFNSTAWSNGSSTINASSVVISAASLTFITDKAPLFWTSPSNDDWFDLVVCYRQVTSDGSERVLSLDGRFFHVGRLMIADPQLHSLEFCIRRFGFERCFDDRCGRIQSVLVRGMGEGRYSFPGWVDGIGGNFTSLDGRIHFTADQNCSFVDVLVFQLPPTSRFDGTVVFGAGFSLAPHALLSMVIEASDDICDSLHPISSVFARSAEWGSSVADDSNSIGPGLGSTTVWIGVGSGLAVIFTGIGGIVLILASRRAMRSGTAMTESDVEAIVPMDNGISSTAVNPFVSEENALSVDGRLRREIARHE
jgi:hypothetical protein